MSDTKYKFLDKSVLYAIEVSKSSSAGRLVFKRRFGINMGSSRGATDLFENTIRVFKTGKAQTLASPTTTLEIFLHGLPMICKVPAQKFHIITCSTACGSKWCGVAPIRNG
jgi:hypothetical protein